MPPRPNWLSPIVSLADFGGDHQAYLAHLHTIFQRDFVASQPRLFGNPVYCDTTDDGGRCATFVHITTKEDPATRQRLIALRRCERVPWVKEIIENHTEPEVLTWEQKAKGGNKRRVYLYLEQERYLIVLARSPHRFFIATAEYVDYPYAHRKAMKNHAAFMKGNPAGLV